MKILNKGNIKGKLPRWDGKIITCRDCKFSAMLEKGDPVQEVSDQRDGDYIRMTCPNCKSDITQSI